MAFGLTWAAVLALIVVTLVVVAVVWISRGGRGTKKAAVALAVADAEPLTVVVTASPVPSHPSTTLVETTVDSVARHVKGNVVKVVLAHDSMNDPDCSPRATHACYPKVQREQFAATYPAYFRALDAYVEAARRRYPFPIEVTTLDHWGGLPTSIKHALETAVDTEHVMIVQHDLPFVRDVDAAAVIRDMREDEALKYVQFNKDPNAVLLQDPEKTGLLQRAFNVGAAPEGMGYGAVKKTKHGQTYIKVAGFSDQDNLTTKGYWLREIWANSEAPRFMEATVNKIAKDDPARFGMWVYGDYDADRMHFHIGGRHERPFLEKYRQLDRK